jgi:hypothetical protein
VRKANTHSSKKAKGKALESWLAGELRKSGADPTAQPMPLSGAMTFFKSDIRTKLPYSFECKNQENTKVWEWYEQAKKDAGSLEKPVVVFKRNYSQPMALLAAQDLVQMIAEIAQYYDIISKKESER